MLLIFWLLFAYFLGSLPFGLLIAKISCGIDPRTEGSKNTGATNVARLCGFKYGITALILDIAKGFIPVVMASQYNDNWMFLSLVALSAIIGHVFSIFLDMRGGKAVATSIGAFLAIAPAATLWAVLFCVIIILLSGYVSMGSLTLAVALPVLALLTGSFGAIVLGCIITLILFWTHRENIRRLAAGKEISWKKK